MSEMITQSSFGGSCTGRPVAGTPFSGVEDDGTMNDFVYAVIGCGMQGTAEAYDLAKFGNARRILMADRDIGKAQFSVSRVNRLTGRSIACPLGIDASDISAVTRMLVDQSVDVCCGAAHYSLNQSLTRASIAAGAHYCDMGGHTGIVMEQHALQDDAVAAGVSVIPDCGIAPGTANVLAARALHHIDCDSVRIFCGGLPQRRDLPLGYRVVFSLAGLTNEYTGQCMEIRDGRRVEIPAFSEREELILPEPLGCCEAFLTSGGSSTGPLSFAGRLKHYSYKTIRYPGHFDAVRAMIDLGLLNLEPLEVNGRTIVPRDVFHVLASRYWDFPDEPDLLVMRVVASGRNPAGHTVQMIQDLLDYQDPDTGFTAMERTTAYSTAIVASGLAAGVFETGVLFLEQAMDPERLVVELARRGIRITTTINPVG